MLHAYPTKSILKSSFAEKIPENSYSSDERNRLSREPSNPDLFYNKPPSSLEFSISTLTSISDDKKDVSASTDPQANLDFLRHIAKRSKRRHQFRRIIRAVQFTVVCILPTCGIILGVIGILVGHFLHFERFFVGGCLLLLSAIGLTIQSCFWGRSLPNKFKPKDIAFNMPTEDSVSETKPDVMSSADCCELEEASSSSKENIPKSTSPMQRKSVFSQNIGVGMNPAQVRRLSMALSRATNELASARRNNNTGGNGMLNLARRLTLAPGFDDHYNREAEAGNGWIAGRVPHGVRRGLAWNETGASRFYASNYD